MRPNAKPDARVAALYPQAPPIDPPGWVDAPHRYTFSNAVRYGGYSWKGRNVPSDCRSPNISSVLFFGVAVKAK